MGQYKSESRDWVSNGHENDSGITRLSQPTPHLKDRVLNKPKSTRKNAENVIKVLL
jgi:hypothetical protein